jgi:hypothetical protein
LSHFSCSFFWICFHTTEGSPAGIGLEPECSLLKTLRRFSTSRPSKYIVLKTDNLLENLDQVKWVI